MDKKSIKIGLIVFGVAATTALAAGVANAAFRDNYDNESNSKRPAFFLEKHKDIGRNGKNKEIIKSLENNDYKAYKAAVADTKMADLVTEEKFLKMVGMHKLVKEGNFKKANQLRKELGMNFPMRPESLKKGRKAQPRVNREAMMQAIENNDYQAYNVAVAGTKMGGLVTEENFPKFVQMHNLLKEGRIEEARALSEELGMPVVRKRGRGMMMRQRKSNQK